MSSGHVAMKLVLDAASTTVADKVQLAGFGAGNKWAKNFMREALVGTSLHGEAGNFGPEASEEDSKKTRNGCEQCDKENVSNVN